jgi:hypothetical protein
VYEGYFFTEYLLTFVLGGVFDDSYSNRSEVKSYYGIDLHFLYAGMVSIFSYVFWLFGILSLKKFCLVQLPTPLLVH